MRWTTLAFVLAIPAIPSVLKAQDDGASSFVILVSGPEEGREAPGFTLPWANRDTTSAGLDDYSLWRDRGKVVVLAFYPRDLTRSDSIQLSTFRDRYDELFGPDVVVVGISTDPIETHRRFAAKLNLPFRLLSDRDQKVAQMYGSKGKDGINRRTVYVIGRDGRVVWRDLRFVPTSEKSYADLRKAVRSALRG